jgi:hypothetical protein
MKLATIGCCEDNPRGDRSPVWLFAILFVLRADKENILDKPLNRDFPPKKSSWLGLIPAKMTLDFSGL